MTIHNAEQIRQHQEHAAIRARLMSSANITEKRKLDSANQTINELNESIAGNEKDIERLTLNIADLYATVIAQARKICELENSGDPEIAYRKPVKRIVEEVLRDYPGVTWQDIVSAKRTKHLVEPRHRCMTAVFTIRPDLSFPMIGKIFMRDHTTILHAVRKMKERSAA